METYLKLMYPALPLIGKLYWALADAVFKCRKTPNFA